ncbi:MAG: bifunctional UDP-sugar hydrolase/5'-nucleotidase [Pseudomonadota bacterium]
MVAIPLNCQDIVRHWQQLVGVVTHASVIVGLACLSGCANTPPPSDTVILSVLGTNDVHGELDGHDKGLLAFSAYVDAVRQLRSQDGGVVLLDAGDMWQGTLESNLNEGAAVMATYNALGYDAATVGNHEFDFGPVGPRAIPESPDDDPRGVIKARAREAQFAFLAANILDEKTNAPVRWPNVTPTVLFTRAGVRIGVIGLSTAETLTSTIGANTVGLEMAPLLDTVVTNAKRLRADGAQLVFVVAHAGGECAEFDDPRDLSSCDESDEIFRLAQALPAGLVNHIVAGHHHEGIAHIVNDVVITSAYTRLRAFDRVDFEVDRVSGKVVNRVVYPPQSMCLERSSSTRRCGPNGGIGDATYEGISLRLMPEVSEIVSAAMDVSLALKSEPLGVELLGPFTRANEPFSLIGKMMTAAIREQSGADIAIHNVAGGIRADFQSGPLTYGDVFRVFPFDNRLTLLDMTGASLRRLLRGQVHVYGRRVGVDGIRIKVACENNTMSLTLVRPDGRVIADEDSVTVASHDYLLLGGMNVFTPVMPEGGFMIDHSQPKIRDLWVKWFRQQGGQLDPRDYEGEKFQQWILPPNYKTACPKS